MEYELFNKVCTEYERRMFDDYCRNRDVTGSNLGWHFKKWYALDWTAGSTKDIEDDLMVMVGDIDSGNSVGLQSVDLVEHAISQQDIIDRQSDTLRTVEHVLRGLLDEL